MPKHDKKNNKGKNNTTDKNSLKSLTNKNVNNYKNNKKVEEVNKIEKIEEIKEVVKNEKKGKENSVSKLADNTPFVISTCVSILLLALLILTLCIKKIPKTSNGDEVIASLKGKKISAEELYQQLKTDNGYDALFTIIDEYIAAKEVTITDADKEYVQGVVDYYKEYAEYYGVDLETFLANYVGLAGVKNEEEFYNFVLKDYKKTLAVQKLIGDKANEEDLKAYYKENFSDKLTVKHILIQIDTEAENQEEEEENAYNKAMEVIEKLNDTKKSKLDEEFEKLAEEYSDDTATYSNGGLIEDFTKSDVVEEFWNESEDLDNGEYTTEPVKTTYGYHVILKVSSTPVEKYNKIKDEVKAAYAKEQLNNDSTLATTMWAELRKQYKLSIEDDEIKKMYKNSLKPKDEKENTEEETTENTEENEETED